MKTLVVLLLLASITLPLWASGMSEDPSEKLTKSWTWKTLKSLEIRGQVDFIVRPGPVCQVTITTSRALFDQLTVRNGWGKGVIAVESGLQGPREIGIVNVVVETPSLGSLSVSDRCTGQVTWPGKSASLEIQDQSHVSLVMNQGNVTVAETWRSTFDVEGVVDKIAASLRRQSQIDTQGALVHEAEVQLDEESGLVAGPTDKASGRLRHSSRLIVLDSAPWSAVRLDEGSVCTVQPSR